MSDFENVLQTGLGWGMVILFSPVLIPLLVVGVVALSIKRALRQYLNPEA